MKLPRWLSDQLDAARALRQPADHLPPDQAGLLFLTRVGTPMQYNSTWQRRVWRASVTAALPEPLHGLRFHDLRHTAVAIALDSASQSGHPLNPKQLQERMGHSTITVTLDRYGHLFDGHDDDVVNAMADPFANRPATAAVTRMA